MEKKINDMFEFICLKCGHHQISHKNTMHKRIQCSMCYRYSKNENWYGYQEEVKQQ